jgi:hypothetical protein
VEVGGGTVNGDDVVSSAEDNVEEDNGMASNRGAEGAVDGVNVVMEDDGDSVTSNLGTKGSDDKGAEAIGDEIALNVVVEVAWRHSWVTAPCPTLGSYAMIVSTTRMNTMEGVDG